MSATVAATCERVLAKNPNAVAVVLQGAAKTSVVALAPTATVADIVAAAREASGAVPKQAITVTVDGCTPSLTTAVADLVGADGHVHVVYAAGKAKMGIAVIGPCFYFSNNGSDGGSPNPTDPGGLLPPDGGLNP